MITPLIYKPFAKKHFFIVLIAAKNVITDNCVFSGAKLFRKLMRKIAESLVVQRRGERKTWMFLLDVKMQS
jgi:hypothetical protein